MIRMPIALAVTLAMMNATRDAGLDKIQAAVPDRFSSRTSSCPMMMAPMGRAMPATAKKTIIPSSHRPPWGSRLPLPLGSANRTAARIPIRIAVQMMACTSHDLVPHQSRFSLRNKLLKPARQPRAVTGCRTLLLVIVALHQTQKDLFQFILLAAELQHVHLRVSQH